MIRHVVFFEFKDGVSQEDIEEMEAALKALPDAIDTIEAYTVGPDIGLSESAVDFAVVADFATPEGYLAYRSHPAHVAAVESFVNPIVARISRIQFEVN
ncbi:MAG: Dabb family protein [Acidimicrobiia bacterium]|nr:Dabb family protein [Acidimicrobiia bacterium]